MLRTRHAPARILAAVAVGGALGALVRYVVSDRFPEPGGRFPWTTFWVNVSGALVLGFVLTMVVERFPPTRYLRPFLATGFCGAYTTFSTFTFETVRLIEEGALAQAALNVAATASTCGLAAAAGLLLASV